MDHLISEMDTYFDRNNNAVMSVQAALQYYASDLPSPQGFDEELFRWRCKWLSVDERPI